MDEGEKRLARQLKSGELTVAGFAAYAVLLPKDGDGGSQSVVVGSLVAS